MAGPAADVYVSPAAIETTPGLWVLKTPQSAVRSYLAWVSYAYRIGQSRFAEPVMSAEEGVRIDSYVQYNIQKRRLIDQTLQSIEFGKPIIKADRALLPAKEKWTYRYVSVESGSKPLDGPYSASYDTTYTLVKARNGGWIVDSVKATALGTVK